MALPLSSRQIRFLPFVFVGVLALLSLLRLTARGAVPWVPIAGLGAITAILVGPLMWLARDRLSEQRRERLALVAFGLVMVLIPIALGLSLALSIQLIPSFDAVIVGSFAGCLLVLIAEQTVVPERLRGIA